MLPAVQLFRCTQPFHFLLLDMRRIAPKSALLLKSYLRAYFALNYKMNVPKINF